MSFTSYTKGASKIIIIILALQPSTATVKDSAGFLVLIYNLTVKYQ